MITDADIARWQREGHPEALIANWIRNEQRAQREVAQMFSQFNRRRNCAPGTPEDAEPTVIEGTATAIMDRPSAADDGGPECANCGNMRHVWNAEHVLIPCPSCRGETVDQWRAAGVEKYSSRSEKAKRQTFANFKRDGHPAAGVPHPTVAQAFDAARAFAINPSGWLVLHGMPGTGKSHLCAAIANALAQAVFVTMPALSSSLKSLFDKRVAQEEGETYEERKHVYQTTPILLIDDIGAGTFSEWDGRLLYDILQPRYENQRPTVLVSNLDMTDVDIFDPRLVDRWSERGFSVMVQITAPSARGMK